MNAYGRTEKNGRGFVIREKRLEKAVS